ncbi:MAG: hypothetical protein DMF96_09595 [Acidobacteria bacterium]|nr:MAG: hypothetical protein DMF96_09595 [Acidobacteriota bacterium]
MPGLVAEEHRGFAAPPILRIPRLHISHLGRRPDASTDGDWLHGSTSGWLTDCRGGGGGGAGGASRPDGAGGGGGGGAPQNRRGSKATVLLEGRVGTDGFLKDLRVLAPADAEFANAALAAVRQWQFTPTRLDGVPMEVRMRVTVNFFMDQ